MKVESTKAEIKNVSPNIANAVLADVAGMTRDAVVPFYERLIKSNPTDEEVVRVNELILSKWTPSGLIYIKEKAWQNLKH